MPFTLPLRSPCVSDCLPLGNRWYLLRYFNALQRVSHRVSGLLARRKKHYVLHLPTKHAPKKCALARSARTLLRTAGQEGATQKPETRKQHPEALNNALSGQKNPKA